MDSGRRTREQGRWSCRDDPHGKLTTLSRGFGSAGHSSSGQVHILAYTNNLNMTSVLHMLNHASPDGCHYCSLYCSLNCLCYSYTAVMRATSTAARVLLYKYRCMTSAVRVRALLYSFHTTAQVRPLYIYHTAIRVLLYWYCECHIIYHTTPFLSHFMK